MSSRRLVQRLMKARRKADCCQTRIQSYSLWRVAIFVPTPSGFLFIPMTPCGPFPQSIPVPGERSSQVNSRLSDIPNTPYYSTSTCCLQDSGAREANSRLQFSPFYVQAPRDRPNRSDSHLYSKGRLLLERRKHPPAPGKQLCAPISD